MTTAIDVKGLRKSYGSLEAVRSVDLEIVAGEVFALLGPNGAGKTTTVEILEGYRRRDAGSIEVLGFDPQRFELGFRERIGIVLQQSQLWPTLTVAETHRMFAGYYSRPRDVDEVIALVGLSEKRDARVKTLSGGQRRRLDLGVALVGDPDLVFLDEPTTGFDPSARRAAWEMIRSLRSLGKTILLTTHYLDEAEQLADRLAVLRAGLIVSEGTPSELTGGTARPRCSRSSSRSSCSCCSGRCTPGACTAYRPRRLCSLHCSHTVAPSSASRGLRSRSSSDGRTRCSNACVRRRCRSSSTSP